MNQNENHDYQQSLQANMEQMRAQNNQLIGQNQIQAAIQGAQLGLGYATTTPKQVDIRELVKKYCEVMGRLLQMKSNLQGMLSNYETLPQAGQTAQLDPGVHLEQQIKLKTDIANAIDALMYPALDPYDKPISKSHATRLVAALSALIDTNLPR